MDIQIFSIPKSFSDPHISLIQRNALANWIALCPGNPALILGDDNGTAEAAKAAGARHIPGVQTNEYGTPRLDSAFRLAHENSTASFLCYTNADILFPKRLLSIPHLMHQPESCLVVGQRIDLQIDEEIRFDCPDWSVQLENRARDDGSLHPAYGSDYFVFPREYYHSLPAFVVGRLGWDNWMITHAHEVGLHVVDASGYLLVLHQNHDYGHQVGSHNARGHDSAAPEARQNCKLAGSRLFGLEGATNLLTENGEMRHNKNPKRIIKQLWYDLCRLNRDKDIK